MIHHPKKTSLRQKTNPRRTRLEGLESRGLLTAGLVGGLNVIENLGEVSRALALQGVEVSAPIASHGSVTFQFGAEASGDYLLKVRYIGEGLTLEAKGPSGTSSSLPTGPAGPFSTLALDLKAGEYEIKASADGDQPVFVDWELLLNSGVGQSAATGTTLATPSSTLVPLATSSPASPSTSTSTATPTPSANWEASVSSSMIAAGRPVGRPDTLGAITPVGPTSGEGELALAYAGDAMPVGALAALGKEVAEEPSSVEALDSPPPLLTLDVLGSSRLDLEALVTPTWFDGLVGLPGSSTVAKGTMPNDPGSTEGEGGSESQVVEGRMAVAVVEESTEPESKDGTTMTASPGLIATGVIVGSALKRWKPNLGRLAKRPAATPDRSLYSRSMN